MGKRLWCAMAAALMLAAAARGQDPRTGPFTAPMPQPQPTPLPTDADVGPAQAPAASDGEGVLAPLFGMARTLAGSDTRVWASADYLFTYMRGMNVPVLATTSPAGTSRADAGVLRDPGTTSLFGGGDRLDGDLRAGFHIAAGVWFNPTFGLEGGFLMTSSEAALYSAKSTNGAILARPYVDANTVTEQAVLIAFPGSSNGSIDIRANSGNLYGANLDLTEKALDIGWFRLYSMIGYQFYYYNESLRVQQSIDPTSSNFVAGTQINSTDNFTASNQFHGVDMGLRAQFTLFDGLSFELLTKCAVGRMQRSVDVNGNTTATVPGETPINLPGGVLALAPNSGSHADSDWRAVPQVGMNFCWEVRPNVTLRAGYSFIYFNQIVRAGEQVDTTINPNLLPGGNSSSGGPARPAFNIQRSDMWVQSLTLGLEYKY